MYLHYTMYRSCWPAGTTYVAFKHSLDQLARFTLLTYCIVGFGAKPEKGELRCGAVLEGLSTRLRFMGAHG
jgi:hypothetical protein